MREIKFRAWDGKRMWHTVTEISWRQKELGGQIFCIRGLYGDKESPIGCHADYADIHRIELMQFTGLLDRNKVEIYVGDVFGEMGGDRDRPEEYEFHGSVYFDEDLAAFCVSKNNGGWEYLHNFLDKYYGAVIGNIYEIYENPELLNK